MPSRIEHRSRRAGMASVEFLLVVGLLVGMALMTVGLSRLRVTEQIARGQVHREVFKNATSPSSYNVRIYSSPRGIPGLSTFEDKGIPLRPRPAGWLSLEELPKGVASGSVQTTGVPGIQILRLKSTRFTRDAPMIAPAWTWGPRYGGPRHLSGIDYTQSPVDTRQVAAWHKRVVKHATGSYKRDFKLAGD